MYNNYSNFVAHAVSGQIKATQYSVLWNVASLPWQPYMCKCSGWNLLFWPILRSLCTIVVGSKTKNLLWNSAKLMNHSKYTCLLLPIRIVWRHWATSRHPRATCPALDHYVAPVACCTRASWAIKNYNKLEFFLQVIIFALVIALPHTWWCHINYK